MQKSGPGLCCWWYSSSFMERAEEKNAERLLKGLKYQTKPSKSITLCGMGKNVEGEFYREFYCESVCGYSTESLLHKETSLRTSPHSALPLALWERLCRGELQNAEAILSKPRQLKHSKARIRMFMRCLGKAKQGEGNKLKVNPDQKQEICSPNACKTRLTLRCHLASPVQH